MAASVPNPMVGAVLVRGGASLPAAGTAVRRTACGDRSSEQGPRRAPARHALPQSRAVLTLRQDAPLRGPAGRIGDPVRRGRNGGPEPARLGTRHQKAARCRGARDDGRPAEGGETTEQVLPEAHYDGHSRTFTSRSRRPSTGTSDGPGAPRWITSVPGPAPRAPVAVAV